MRQGIESILSPKQQRRHLPSLLYKSFLYAVVLDRPYDSDWPLEGDGWDFAIDRAVT